MKKGLCILLAAITLLLSACGGIDRKHQAALQAFNDTTTIFNDTAVLINQNPSAVSGDIISAYQEVAAQLTQYKTQLDGDNTLTDTQYDEMLRWLADTKKWAQDYKDSLSGALAGTKQETENALHAASLAYNEAITYINAHLDDVDQTIIDSCQSVATTLRIYSATMEQETDLTRDQYTELTQGLRSIESWATNTLQHLKSTLE